MYNTMYRAELIIVIFNIMKRPKCLSCSYYLSFCPIPPSVLVGSSLFFHFNTAVTWFFLSTMVVNDVAFFSQSTINDILDRCKEECNRFV